jgi:hypothetical protein
MPEPEGASQSGQLRASGPAKISFMGCTEGLYYTKWNVSNEIRNPRQDAGWLPQHGHCLEQPHFLGL